MNVKADENSTALPEQKKNDMQIPRGIVSKSSNFLAVMITRTGAKRITVEWEEIKKS